MKYPRQKQKYQINHDDDWLMTYADMITLLLCFFAIFLSLSMPKKPEIANQAVPPVNSAEGILPYHGVPRVEMPVIIIPDDIKNDKPTAILPDIAEHLKSQGTTALEQKGDRITTIEMSSAAFFDKGSATLSEAGKSILMTVVQNLLSPEYNDYQITVEGHTDDTPISTLQFPSNWELSTARASAVVHFFLDQGIAAQKLRAAGYADTFPKAPNRDISNTPLPENQAQNRRVVIKLEKIDKNP